MDDRRFDDIIKGKVDNYQPEAFDPTALADLHHRVASVPVQVPWYSSYRTELLVASAILVISAFNAIFFWLPSQRSINDLSGELSSLRTENQQINELQNDLAQLRLENTGIVDTVYLQSENSELIYQLASLNARLNRLIAQQASEDDRPKDITDTGLIYLGKDEDIPEDIRFQLLRNIFIFTQVN